MDTAVGDEATIRLVQALVCSNGIDYVCLLYGVVAGRIEISPRLNDGYTIVCAKHALEEVLTSQTLVQRERFCRFTSGGCATG